MRRVYECVFVYVYVHARLAGRTDSLILVLDRFCELVSEMFHGWTRGVTSSRSVRWIRTGHKARSGSTVFTTGTGCFLVHRQREKCRAEAGLMLYSSTRQSSTSVACTFQETGARVRTSKSVWVGYNSMFLPPSLPPLLPSDVHTLTWMQLNCLLDLVGG